MEVLPEPARRRKAVWHTAEMRWQWIDTRHVSCCGDCDRLSTPPAAPVHPPYVEAEATPLVGKSQPRTEHRGALKQAYSHKTQDSSKDQHRLRNLTWNCFKSKTLSISVLFSPFIGIRAASRFEASPYLRLCPLPSRTGILPNKSFARLFHTYCTSLWVSSSRRTETNTPIYWVLDFFYY